MAKSLCIIGLGYIGLPTACTFAANGVQVLGVDKNPSIITSLRSSRVHIQEPGLQEILDKAIMSGNLTVSETVQPCDAYLIAVPTPFHADKSADMSFVKAAAESIRPHLKPGNLVILESTSPPRTTLDILAPILEKSGLKAGADFSLAYSPERVLPGKILHELINNARVIGGINESSAKAGKELYSVFVKGDIILTDATTAEMVKLMENTFRDINIAAANEFAQLAEKFGVDVWEAIQLANRHPRVNILKPGPGVGGHCISVDPWFLVEAAPEQSTLIRAARTVNDQQPDFVVKTMRSKLGELENRRVTALGLSYKPDVDDLRESPAIHTVEILIEMGAQVTVFEPFKKEIAIQGARIAESLVNAVKDVEIILLLVNHTEFQSINPLELYRLTGSVSVFDCVSGWDSHAWQNAGFHYYRLGDGKLNNV